MPTLLSSVFATRRAACSQPAAASTSPRETFQAKPFIPNAPYVEHTIKDTLAYINLVRDKSSTAVVAEYAHRFVTGSAEMRKLDEAQPAIMMTPNKPQTFPNIVVELGRLIPHDADGSLTSRKDFLVTGLARSLTLRANLATYDTEQGLDTTGTKPSAAWALRRAFRSFGDDEAAIASFTAALSEALPQSKWEIAHIYRDYQLTPKLRKADVAVAAPIPPR